MKKLWLNMSLEKLTECIQKSWSTETSKDVNWNEKNLARGQCVVTALVVQDYFGGVIVSCKAVLPNNKRESHYFNLINGTYIDLTRQQFPPDTIFLHTKPKTKVIISLRDYCLSNKNTQKRYDILKEKIEHFVNKDLK